MGRFALGGGIYGYCKFKVKKYNNTFEWLFWGFTPGANYDIAVSIEKDYTNLKTT